MLLNANSISSAYEYTSLSKDVKVLLNGESITFDTQPLIIDGRTLVPFRAVLEKLGATIEWYGDTKTVKANKDNTIITLQIDNKVAYIGGEQFTLDVPPIIINGRTLIPVRFICEGLGYEIKWDESSRTVNIIYSSNSIFSKNVFSFRDLRIGMEKDELIRNIGQPSRIDLSEYGFEWYIYNNDYSKYIQVGVKNNRVVAVYTNSSYWLSEEGLNIGFAKSKIVDKYGQPLEGIKKGNTVFRLNNEGSEVYLLNNSYTTVFYDLHSNETVTAVMMIDKNTEESLNGWYGEPNEELIRAYERQIFDLANSIRARFNKEAFMWHDDIAETARKHSKDMATRKFFSHINPDGKSPFDRMSDDNIQYSMAAENIASGQTNAIMAHEGWMNSLGHRKNILGDCKYLGVGVYMGGDYHIYYTQNFFTQR